MTDWLGLDSSDVRVGVGLVTARDTVDDTDIGNTNIGGISMVHLHALISRRIQRLGDRMVD